MVLLRYDACMRDSKFQVVIDALTKASQATGGRKLCRNVQKRANVPKMSLSENVTFYITKSVVTGVVTKMSQNVTLFRVSKNIRF